MVQAVSISLSKFTASVQATVKAAVTKHPNFKIDVPNGVTVAYLIRGIPVPEAILRNVTIGETQAFAADVATHKSGFGNGAVRLDLSSGFSLPVQRIRRSLS